VTADGLRASEEKMRAAGVPDVAIRTFQHHYKKLAAGDAGVLRESEIEPVSELPSVADLTANEPGKSEALDRTVIVKVNGGLGTSMGLPRAKSLLTAKDGRSFLDIIANQVLALRQCTGARLPLVLMNSFHTREDSLTALGHHSELATDVPPDFLQNREPKIRVDDLHPVSWPAKPELEWCPPGHGDVYTALVSSGMLATLLEHGYRHMFISNVDNLGAVLDPRILGWIASEDIPFLSEQSERTEADRKGGHLVRRRSDGRLVLRETAQIAPDDVQAFEDIGRHRYFNTNNLWVNLEALDALLSAHDGVLELPLIRNEKTVDPADPSTPAVYQLETAMGSAIGVFAGARALQVGRERFLPVKTTDDLLGLRSDCYELTDDFRVVVSPRRTIGPLVVALDPHYYKLLADFDARFPAGPPSLAQCERLAVRGDVTFGRDVVVRGRVELDAAERRRLGDGTVLEG